MSEPKHCYDYIKDESQPECLRRYLKFHTAPAYVQMRARDKGIAEPILYATVNVPDESKDFYKKLGVANGCRVKLVMASRLGDVGITADLKAWRGYDARVYVEWLKDFSSE